MLQLLNRREWSLKELSTTASAMDTWKCSISLRWNYWIHIFIVILLHLSQFVHSAPLSSYLVSSFTSPDPTLPFNHITIYNVTGNVYIGARERLYQLNPDLTLFQTVNVGPCPSPEGNEPINDNKLLVVAPSPYEKLVTCGSCDGYCETRSLANVANDVESHEGKSEQAIVLTSDAMTVGVIARGSEFDGNGMGIPNGDLYLLAGHSFTEFNGLRPVSKHRLSDLEAIQRILDYNLLPEDDVNNYVQLTYIGNYVYFFIQRKIGGQYNIHVGQVCLNSLDLNLDSYTEIVIDCGNGQNNFSLFQAAHIGPAGSRLSSSFGISSNDNILYAVFAVEGTGHSALCLYKMTDIQQRFKDAIDGCINGESSKGETNGLLQSTCNQVST